MALVGFNPEEVRLAIENISSSYNSLVNSLINKNQSDFVVGMSSIWACEQAQNFFNAYQKDIADLNRKIESVYLSIINSMNKAASVLAGTSGTEWSYVKFSPLISGLDISVIKDNINGVKGIDLANTPDVLSKLDTINSEISTALESTKTAVSSSGFIGGGMQEQLVSSISTIQNNVNQAFGQIKADVNTAIQATLDQYSSGVAKINTAFAGGESDGSSRGNESVM